MDSQQPKPPQGSPNVLCCTLVLLQLSTCSLINVSQKTEGCETEGGEAVRRVSPLVTRTGLTEEPPATATRTRRPLYSCPVRGNHMVSWYTVKPCAAKKARACVFMAQTSRASVAMPCSFATLTAVWMRACPTPCL